MSNSQPITDDKLDELMEWPAYIDKDLMYTIENDCQEHCHSVNRRVLLSVLTMDSEKLFEACESVPEAYFEGFKCSASTLGSLKRLVRLLDIAHHRLMVGLCGVDFNAAEAPFSKQELDAAIKDAKGDDSQ
ncbi:MAG: hypothetical protein IIA09_18395 [Proteobacteria bacterium]|nr:hypothetical protein [Pseudomonadota bacterium]